MRFHKTVFILRLLLAIHVVGSCVLGATVAWFLYLSTGVPPDSSAIAIMAIGLLSGPFNPRLYGIIAIMAYVAVRGGAPIWMSALICIPWLISVILTTVWMLRRFRRQERRRRFVLKKCVECGYDLRGTPDGCPECGAPRIWEAI